MKTFKKNSVNKLLTRFDNELKALLVNDLNNVRSIKNQFLHSNHQARLQIR
ncbi:MAG: hypothetical protein JWQ66_923 [Mucilaginibacter sp.]|nr:hypothetical protein [Mucilaginibacter sp.]